MQRSSSFSLWFLTILYVVALTSCGSEDERPDRTRQKLSRDNWLISGQVANAGFLGGEVLALSLDGMRYRTRIDDDQAFAIQLPGNASYALYFLEGTDSHGDDAVGAVSAHKAGSEAILNFEESPDVGIRDTLRLPKVLLHNTLNLGQIDIKGGQAFPSTNPALSLDFDNDGINDFADRDDHNDGLSDLDQQRETERIQICHFDDDNRGKTVQVALADLFNHVEDGDSLGPCIASRPESPVDASEKEVEGPAHTAPAPPVAPAAPQAKPMPQHPGLQNPAVAPPHQGKKSHDVHRNDEKGDEKGDDEDHSDEDDTKDGDTKHDKRDPKHDKKKPADVKHGGNRDKDQADDKEDHFDDKKPDHADTDRKPIRRKPRPKLRYL